MKEQKIPEQNMPEKNIPELSMKEQEMPEFYTCLAAEIKEKLAALAEPVYASFSAKLLPGTEHILGVRLPVLRRLAKDILKRLPKEDGIIRYLQTASAQSFEEIMLQGFVIGYSALEEEQLMAAVERFLPLIDNWSVCDSFCTTMKQMAKNQEQCFALLQNCLDLSDERPFYRRFAIVMMLHYFISEEYLDRVLLAMEKAKSDHYYVNMARAWCISMCYISFEERTTEFLQNACLDDFTFRKSIRKICESTVVRKASKESLQLLLIH